MIRRLEKAERKTLAELKTETGKLARLFDRKLSKNAKPAKRASKQDTFGGNDEQLPQVRPFRVTATESSDRRVIKIEIVGHWVGARSKAMTAILKYLGRDRARYRAGLWVINGKGRGVRARNAKGPAKFLFFASNPRLKVWAERRNKGEQILRHVIRADSKILRLLLLGPLLRKSRQQIKQAWKAALKRGFS